MSAGSVLRLESVAPDYSIGSAMRSLEISARFESEVYELDKSNDSMDDESDCEGEFSREVSSNGDEKIVEQNIGTWAVFLEKQ